ncbi:metalloenzyme [Stigmatella aurantiaca]|uniref:Metalloenzyme domain protein n=1 Tax=Stigmatella aurantiaca (strain DW4/3-1) TaxID=378806 RepID=Q08ZX4_STIAD|nr:metalloenzyme [Stigmatella aurantiaca]ADO71226.1 Metalloenzyme domain protein [Stigmatella aurantiaca DW4/3-1]EAU66033.1 metalloenzyme superfamily protein [Stigmatella aurantiaca DW4/3-1]
MRVALLFIDGVGVGRKDPSVNPLARREHLLSRFGETSGSRLPENGQYHPVDTTFGVEGRPQSASNQTAILTGEPAPALIRRHVLGYPNAPLQGLLSERSLVKRLVTAGRSATFANTYPASYLDALKLPRRPSTSPPEFTFPPAALRRLKASASTLAFAAGQVPLRTLDDARGGEGLSHDITGQRALNRGLLLPQRTPEEAARIFWRVAEGMDFTFFEHYLADEAGHAQDFEAALSALDTFEHFARSVIATRPEDARILICSDHGNVEDLSTRSHTLNPVPVLYFGPPAPELEALATVADVGRTVLRWLAVE